MKTNFTPGPWKFNSRLTPETVEVLEVPAESDSVWKRGFLSKTIGVDNSNGERLADVKAYTTKGFLQDFEQWEGNAKLIVAAPEMYEVLKELTEPFSSLMSVPAGAKFTVTYDAELVYKALNLIIKATT